MTDRALMQQALEALEMAHIFLKIDVNRAIENDRSDATIREAEESERKHAKAIAALRARLAEPEPEPVAFRWKVKINDVDGWVVGHNEPPPYAIEQQPLYTAPPARRPLTDEEILRLLRPAIWAHVESHKRTQLLADARAIERKITGGNDE